MPEAATQTAQGITTARGGRGRRRAAARRRFPGPPDAAPAAVNVATMVGHGDRAHEGDGRGLQAAGPPRRDRGHARAGRPGMAEGAFGLSSGLEYDPGYYSTTESSWPWPEVAAGAAGSTPRHIRNEARRDAARAGGGHGDRLARPASPSTSRTSSWAPSGSGAARAEALRILHDAARNNDVTADWYPYNFWASTTYVLMTGGARPGGPPGLGEGARGRGRGGATSSSRTSRRTTPTTARPWPRWRRRGGGPGGRPHGHRAPRQRRHPRHQHVRGATWRRSCAIPLVMVSSDGGIRDRASPRRGDVPARPRPATCGSGRRSRSRPRSAR